MKLCERTKNHHAIMGLLCASEVKFLVHPQQENKRLEMLVLYDRPNYGTSREPTIHSDVAIV